MTEEIRTVEEQVQDQLDAKVGVYYTIVKDENSEPTTQNFVNKRDVIKSLNGVKESDILGVFRGKKLSLSPRTEYELT